MKPSSLEERINAILEPLPSTAAYRLDFFGTVGEDITQELRGKVIALNLIDKKVLIDNSLDALEQRRRTAWPTCEVRYIGGPPIVDLTLDEMEDK